MIRFGYLGVRPTMMSRKQVGPKSKKEGVFAGFKKAVKDYKI